MNPSAPRAPGCRTTTSRPWAFRPAPSPWTRDAARASEHAQEHTRRPGRHLLHAARLIRDPDRYITRFGQANYDIKLGDCLWHIYRMIGKLSSRVYLLSAPGPV
jgi:hypothetical protein